VSDERKETIGCVRVEEKACAVILILAIEMFNCHMAKSVCGTGKMEDKRNGGDLDCLTICLYYVIMCLFFILFF
jgi:hypothetical protein